jgi:hypothetical protein
MNFQATNSAFAENQLSPMEKVVTNDAQLVHALTYDSAPWLYAALSQIWNSERTGEDVPGIGNLHVTQSAADGARIVILNVGFRDLPTPSIAKVSGGGLGMFWTLGGKRLEFTAYPDGEVVFLSYENGVVKTS